MIRKKNTITFTFIEVDGRPAADVKTRGNVDPEMAIRALSGALMTRLNALYPTDRLALTYEVFGDLSEVIAQLGREAAVSPEIMDEVDKAVDELGEGH